jgi:hypothetical protein
MTNGVVEVMKREMQMLKGFPQNGDLTGSDNPGFHPCSFVG